MNLKTILGAGFLLMSVLFGLAYFNVIGPAAECPPSPASATCGPVYGLITQATGQKLADNYKASIANASSAITTPDDPFDSDSRATWFSYQDLYNFLCAIKNQYEANPSMAGKELGVRIYYGRYPAGSEIPSFGDLNTLPASFGQRHCVFMVPTVDEKNAAGTDMIHKDAFFNISGYLASSISGKEKQQQATTAAAILTGGAEKNHGGLTPPYTLEGASFITP